jgi:psiF repeat-containing protein
MKLIPALSLAALLAAGSAFAADAPAAPAPATTKAQPDHHCRNEANDKKLAGAARKSFIKKCVAESRAAH